MARRRVIAGEANEVYEINLAKQQVYLRISRRSTPDFDQENWAIEQAKKAGVPVPEVLLIKHLPFNGELLSFCVQKKVEGEVLDRGSIEFDKYDNGIKRKIINQAGEILSQIHSIKTDGFGPIDGNGKGNCSSYRQLMLKNASQKEEYRN